MTAPYQKLLDHYREIALLESCSALLSWDQETYLPRKGVSYRAQQRAALGERIHQLKISQEIGSWLEKAEPDADSEGAANLSNWRHEYQRARALPPALVGELEETTSLALSAWQEAREKDAFPHFAPHLQKIVELKQRMAELWGYEDSPYDALLEEYERGARSSALASLFQSVRPPLVELADTAVGQDPPALSLQGDYPIEAQKAFNLEVCRAIGFDLEAGRLDTTAHPFCSRLAPYDTRLTTRYDPHDFTNSFFGVLHETGHGLYEQGLPQDRHGLPSGTAVSLGIHESQSRLWENQVGRSRAFWEHWLPRAQHYFPSLASWTPEAITRAVNQAERSFIRVEADEVTYDLHIMLRFDIERRLFEHQLTVDDIPEAWNATFKDLTGLDISSDRQGCLQDIHWSLGAFGYFPTYSLGNLNAAQLFSAALEQSPGISTDLERGQYASLLHWLREHVHAHGSRYLPDDLMIRATGRPPEAAPYLDHLRSRYLPSSSLS